jgi:hypothetical protein
MALDENGVGAIVTQMATKANSANVYSKVEIDQKLSQADASITIINSTPTYNQAKVGKLFAVVGTAADGLYFCVSKALDKATWWKIISSESIETIAPVDSPMVALTGLVSSNISDSGFTISWDHYVTPNANLQIYLDGVLCDTIALTADQYVFSYLDASHSYQVSGIVVDGNSVKQNSLPADIQVITSAAVQAMAAISNLTVTDIATNGMKLNWASYVDAGAVPVIEIFRNGTSIAKFDLTSAIISYVVSSLSENTLYNFSIIVTDKNGVKVASSSVSASGKTTISGSQSMSTLWTYDFEILANQYQKDFTTDLLFTHGVILVDDFY